MKNGRDAGAGRRDQSTGARGADGWCGGAEIVGRLDVGSAIQDRCLAQIVEVARLVAGRIEPPRRGEFESHWHQPAAAVSGSEKASPMVSTLQQHGVRATLGQSR